MTVDCPKCKKIYRIDESLIPVGGAHVQCPACSNVFSIYRAPLDIPLEPVKEKPVTTSPPEKELKVETEPLKPIQEEPAVAEGTKETATKPAGIDSTIPPVEERTKLWEKLQKSYAAEKKPPPESPTETEETATIEPTISSDDKSTFESPPQDATGETATIETASKEAPPTEPQITPPDSEAASSEAPSFKPTPPQETTPPTAVEEPAADEDKTIKDAKRLARSLVKDILLYHGDKVEIGLRQGNLAQLIGDEIRKSWKFYKDSFPLDKTNNVNYFKEALNEIIGKGKPIFK